MGVSLFRSISNQYEHLRSVNTVVTMNAISHQIENQIINHRLPVDFYAGFQRFSRFPAQHRLYQQLGAVCRRVYVFGVPDVKPPTLPGVEFIALDPVSPLTREWFLLVDTPDFWTALLTQETGGQDALAGGRGYDGIWTYDQQVVERASLLISQELSGYYAPVRTRNHEAQSRHIAEISGRIVTSYENSRMVSRRRWSRLLAVQHVSEALNKPQLARYEQSIAQIMQTMFGAEDVAIALHKGGDQYRIVVPVGTPDGKLRALRPSDGPTSRAISEGALIHIGDVRQSRAHDSLLPNAQSLVSAPIIGQHGIHGAITVGGGVVGQWSEEDAQTVMTVANMLALAIEQSSEVSGTVTAQLERARQLQMAVINLRKPVANLLDWQQRLRDEAGDLQPSMSFLEALTQVEALSVQLAQTIGVNRSASNKVGV